MNKIHPCTDTSPAPPAPFPPPPLHHHPPLWDLGSPVLGSDPGVLGDGGTVTQLGPSPGIAARHPVNLAPPPLRGGVPLSQLKGGDPGAAPPGRLPGIKPASVSLPAAKPRALAALQRSRARGDVGEGKGFLPCSPPSSSGNPPPARGAPQEDEEKPPLSLPPHKSIRARHGGGGGGCTPRRVRAGWRADSPRPPPHPGGAAGWGAAGGARAVPPGPAGRGSGAAPCT